MEPHGLNPELLVNFITALEFRMWIFALKEFQSGVKDPREMTSPP